jgi:hypothetical protein
MKIAIEGNELVIRVDLNTRGTLSKSGKSQVLASTEGFTSVTVPQFGSVKIGLNVITTDSDWTGGPRPEAAKPSLVKNGQAPAAAH